MNFQQNNQQPQNDLWLSSYNVWNIWGLRFNGEKDP